MSDSALEIGQDGCDANELRQQLERAQAGERRAQALIESAASLMGAADIDEVLAGIAENAVRHIGFPRVTVYRSDHEAGTLVEVASAAISDRATHPTLPGLAPVRFLEVATEPVALEPGHLLAEFALGDIPMRALEPGEPSGGKDHCVLVQMRAVGSGALPRGALIGVIAASSEVVATERQVRLLSALATLGAAAAEAARLDRFRAQLVSAVSHELRTPLAAIRAYNELLLDGDAGEINEEQRLFLQRVEATCLQLDRMVEDLLDLSRLRTGEMLISRGPTDVVAVIEHIIDTLSPETARQEVTLRDEIVGDLPPISSNSDRLAQVLFNLVGNAVKYVGRGGHVLVRAGLRSRADCPKLDREATGDGSPCGDRCLVIEVIDDGPGIAPEDVKRIFDEFYRGRLAEGQKKGSGLGLAIASRLTRLLGGTLGVESTPGEGSTFYLLFPVPAERVQ